VEAQKKRYLKLRPQLAKALSEFKNLIYKGAVTVQTYEALEALIAERYYYLIFMKYTYPRSTEYSDLRLEMNRSLLSLEKQYLALTELMRSGKLTQSIVDAERIFFAQEIDFLVRARTLSSRIEGSPDGVITIPWEKRVQFAQDNEKAIEDLIRAHRSSIELIEKKEADKLRARSDPDFSLAFDVIIELCRLNAEADKARAR
jgi:hypothetical protein